MALRGERLTEMVDSLQLDIDDYVQNHEGLVTLYNALLVENECLRDKIALLMEKQSGRQRN